MNEEGYKLPISKEEKGELIKRYTPKTKTAKTVALAAFFGGLICALGELIRQGLLYLGVDGDVAPTLVSLIFVTLASLFTALGLFSRIARVAGAGTLVPITGFSNSITSEAIDSSSEGYVLGVGAKIFTVAGPVLLYGTLSGVLYGIYLYVSEMIGR